MQSSAIPTTTQPAYTLRRGVRPTILIRHAKAMEEDVGGDHARALSERGLQDAGALGQWLKENGLTPDVAVCSTATRTRMTLGAITHNVPTILSDKLYLASAGEMLAQLHALDDANATVMLVAHNPGSHALLALLVAEYANEDDADKVLLKFPTSACAVLDFDAASWRDVAASTGRLVALRY